MHDSFQAKFAEVDSVIRNEVQAKLQALTHRADSVEERLMSEIGTQIKQTQIQSQKAVKHVQEEALDISRTLQTSIQQL